MRQNAFFNLGLWLVPLLLLGSAAGVPAQEQEKPVCAKCHEEMAAKFLHSFHEHMWKGQGRSQANVCQTCHGPADRHLQNPSRETIVSFGPKSAQSPEEQSRVCLGCHASFKEVANWEMSEHKRNDIACVSCHTIHAINPKPNQPEVCFGCHHDIKMQANKFSHHPVIEGKIKCSDCHNTHGTLSRHMIRAENVNQLCYQCHADKRGPFIWEHPPVEENCATCHNPHGSRHENLLVEKVPNLCQDCHSDSQHPGTPYDAKSSFLGSNPSNRFYARSCLNCHGNIHGSSTFGDQRFTR